MLKPPHLRVFMEAAHSSFGLALERVDLFSVKPPCSPASSIGTLVVVMMPTPASSAGAGSSVGIQTDYYAVPRDTA